MVLILGIEEEILYTFVDILFTFEENRNILILFEVMFINITQMNMTAEIILIITVCYE